MMKSTLKRVMMLMLALTLLAGAMMPAAMAAEAKVVSNASNVSVYAGMKSPLTVYDKRTGEEVSASSFNWKSSDKKVVKVSAGGVLTGMKAGKATVTGTRKGNKNDKVTAKVTVLKNKVDKINPKPSKTAVSYQNWGLVLKSVEIVSPSKVVVEYYVTINFPSSWRATKVMYISDAINLYDPNTGEFVKTIVGDSYQVKSTKISGFKAKKGKSVQTIKVTFSGGKVHCADIRLADYRPASSLNRTGQLKYYH